MTKKSPKKRVLKYFLLLIAVSMIFYAFKSQKEYNNLKNVLVEDKQELQNELGVIVKDYKKLNIKNKKLSNRVITEINKIIVLKDSVKTLEVENFNLIREFRKRTVKLQENNKYLLAKVDSLNTVNTDLKNENILANETLKEKNIVTQNLKNKNQSLTKLNRALNKRIEPAKKIKTSTVRAIAMKEKSSGKLASTTKSSKTDVIRVNFKLLENTLTVPGNKKIHIQLQDQQNNVVSEKNETLLKNEAKIGYSDELIANYHNEEIEVLSLILVDRKNMEKGEYKVNVFIDGDFSSTSVVTLR